MLFLFWILCRETYCLVWRILFAGGLNFNYEKIRMVDLMITLSDFPLKKQLVFAKKQIKYLKYSA